MNQASISGFTFIRNGTTLGFPFVESIRSLLPLVDEFVVVVGKSNDDTLVRIQDIGDAKIKIIETVWNDKMADRGFVYAQQKMIGQFNCTGDWAFYLEGDEVVHENDLVGIRAAVDKHHANAAVEALVFDYHHFYGSPQHLATSPAWYRRESRLVRNSIRTYAPDGQYWLAMHRHKRPRTLQAALVNAPIYHYGWVRRTEQMQTKLNQVAKYWRQSSVATVDYGNIDPKAISPFNGSHPAIMAQWLLQETEPHFRINPEYQLTKRERKHRLVMWIEKWTGWDLSHKHYKLVA